MQNKKKLLKPIEPSDSWHEQLSVELSRVFKKGIYDDLLKTLKETSDNASESTSLEAAIRSGKIRYRAGKFSGEMSAAISKELKEFGATFDARSKVWVIDAGRLPQAVQAAISASTRNVLLLRKLLFDKLEYATGNVSKLVKLMDLDKIANSTMAKTSREFKETVVDAMAVQPKLSTGARILFDEDYVKSITRPIKAIVTKANKEAVEGSAELFAQEETERLRREIEKWVMSGKSRKGLADMIQERIPVSRERAKFIARQETALISSTFKQAQYKAAGLNRYVWRAVMDDRTRHDHELLDGKTFSWDDPPVINLKTQVKGHPGFDFNCRCTAQPVVEF